jgi:hypothetical protein
MNKVLKGVGGTVFWCFIFTYIVYIPTYLAGSLACFVLFFLG